jgi:hypothetical protein
MCSRLLTFDGIDNAHTINKFDKARDIYRIQCAYDQTESTTDTEMRRAYKVGVAAPLFLCSFVLSRFLKPIENVTDTDVR